jgi:hypothetical protein
MGAVTNLESARSHLETAWGVLSAMWAGPHDADDPRFDAVHAELEEAGRAIDAELAAAGGQRQAARLLYAEFEALEEELPPRFD